MFYFHKKHLLIGVLITLDILLLADIVNKKNISLNTLVSSANLSKKPNGEVAGTRTIKRKAVPTRVSRTDLDTSLTKVRPSKSPSPKSIWVAPTSVPKISGNTNSGLLNQINDFRSSKGKSALSEEPTTCSFASLRAGEIVSNFTHDGFRNRIDSKTLLYPSYSSVAENIAMNSNPNQVVPNWINSAGHNEIMLKDAPYGCVVGNGDYYVFEAWAP